MNREFTWKPAFHNASSSGPMADSPPSMSVPTELCRQDFQFELPADLIAQYPPVQRSASRLLTLEGSSGALEDRQFTELPHLLRPGDVLVFNDTRVIPARLYGHKASGGRFELLIEHLLDDQRALVHLRVSKPPQPGTVLHLDGGFKAMVLARRGDLFEIHHETDQAWLALLEQHGHIPLPPYIQRTATAQDRERYQTVYARHPGAVAAPTAGLHFDPLLLDQLDRLGVERACITLHVGAGTFQPLRVERLSEHVMHSERVTVDAKVCAQIRTARQRGQRVIAVGTTAVRALETATDARGVLQPWQGETRLFIYPGYRFRSVDALITNFHLPESTLLMLVAAFAGHAAILRAYRHAVNQRYRFFSYGDAMFITRHR